MHSEHAMHHSNLRSCHWDCNAPPTIYDEFPCILEHALSYGNHMQMMGAPVPCIKCLQQRTGRCGVTVHHMGSGLILMQLPLCMLQEQLGSLTKDFTSTAASAQRTLRGLFGGRGKPAPSPVPDLDAVPTGKLRPGYGSQQARDSSGGGTGTGSQREKATPSSGTGGFSLRLPGTGSQGVKVAVGAGSRKSGSGSAKAKAQPKSADGASLHCSAADAFHSSAVSSLVRPMQARV